jgi:LacI family transcriptional regulator
MGSKLTISDIARLAGVSKATVSRVINQKTNVDPVTRERVLRVINEKGFVPSITASGLAGGRSRLIGVLTLPFTQPFVPEIMRGVAELMEHTSYEIVLYSINPTSAHTDVLDRIIGMRLTSGLLAIMPRKMGKHLSDLRDHGLPVVVIDDQGPLIDLPWVGIDNRESAYQATRHLIELGHRRIAHVEGPVDFRCTDERYDGYQQALLDAGITPEPELLFKSDFTTEGGREIAEQIFALDESERPSAIFSANDNMAYGILDVAGEYSIRVPEDVAIVGFDDMPLSRYMRPALTTIRQPFYDIGKVAIELLLSFVDPQFSLPEDQTYKRVEAARIVQQLLNDREGQQPLHCQLPTRLVVRDSCGAAQHISLNG